MLTLEYSVGIKIPLSEKDKVPSKRSDSQLSRTSQTLGAQSEPGTDPAVRDTAHKAA